MWPKEIDWARAHFVVTAVFACLQQIWLWIGSLLWPTRVDGMITFDSLALLLFKTEVFFKLRESISTCSNMNISPVHQYQCQNPIS